MTTSIQERHDAKMRLRLDASDGALIFEDFIGALAYDIGCETRDPADVMNRLADLIEPEPERTCRDDDDFVFRCSSCGAFIKRGSVTDCCGSTMPIRFCPNCGAARRWWTDEA